MNISIAFRKINDIEWKMIKKTLSKISTKIIPFLMESEWKLFISFENSSSKDFFPLIYLVPKELITFIGRIGKNFNILCSGLYFGMLRKGKFNVSLEGADFLLRFDCFNDDSKIFVNDDGEKSILYGNHILKRDISRISPKLYKNQFLLVLNSSHELIALAKSRVNYLESKKLNPNDLLAFYFIDRGYYLREDQ